MLANAEGVLDGGEDQGHAQAGHADPPMHSQHECRDPSELLRQISTVKLVMLGKLVMLE